MKTKFLLSAVLVCFGLTAGANTAPAQKLYPVSGPQATVTPAPVFPGHLVFRIVSVGSSYKLLQSFTLASQEIVKGKFNSINAASAVQKSAGSPDSFPPQPNLAFAWDSVKGQGYYMAHVLGNTIEQGIFTGDKGTVLQVESLDGRNGVAVDNRGNVYKFVW
jgi:hypothetical protein